MRFYFNAAIYALAGLGCAAPFTFPLSNGFPNLSSSALVAVEMQAGGYLTNMPLPTSLQANGVTAFQIIALSQFFEVAYFTSLLQNVTNGVSGYTDVGNKTFVINTLKTIQAQEELHAVGANNILKAAGQTQIKPCNYTFPVDNYNDAIVGANKFTDIIIASLESVLMELAVDGGSEATSLVPLLGSITEQEGEQDGFYRIVQNKVPSAAPFLTGSVGQYVFNIINQMYTVPGSCPNANLIDVPIYAPLNVLTMPPAANSTVQYSTTATGISSSANSIVYMSGRIYPVTVSISNITTTAGVTSFTANFPFDSEFSNGLTVAALVKGTGSFTSGDAVANATIAGPGLIEVN